MIWAVVIGIAAAVYLFAMALCKAASDCKWEDEDDEHH